MAVENQIGIVFPIGVQLVGEHSALGALLSVEIMVHIIGIVAVNDRCADLIAGDDPADHIRIDPIKLGKPLRDGAFGFRFLRIRGGEEEGGLFRRTAFKHIAQLVLVLENHAVVDIRAQVYREKRDRGREMRSQRKTTESDLSGSSCASCDGSWQFPPS